MKPLTEQDVTDVWCRVPRDGQTLVHFANAILAKFGHCHALPGVSEAEARERERAACLVGWISGFAANDPDTLGADWLKRYKYFNGSPSSVDAMARAKVEADRIYPSLTPKPPRHVTLSDGVMYIYEAHPKYEPNRPGWREILSNGEDGALYRPGPPCVTAEDFEKCAALLRETEK